MSDIFREVEEDVRRERFAKLWKQYGDYAIAAAAVAVIAIAGFEVWQRYDAGQRAKASAAFIAAQEINIPGAAEASFSRIAHNAPGGYRLLARLEEANAMAENGRSGDAIELYESIAHDDNGPVGATARLRAAWALADSAGKDDLAVLLAPLTNDSSAWSEAAREVLAYSDYRAAHLTTAEAEYESLAVDPQTPDSLRQRARAMADFLKSGGAANFGTVPPPPAASATVPAPTTAASAAAAKLAATPAKGAAKP